MGLLTAIAGRYSATWAQTGDTARSLGVMTDGYTIATRLFKQLIDQTDAYAKTPVEGIYQGAQVTISGVAKEWLAGSIRAVNPYSGWAGTGATGFLLNTVGKLDTDNDGSLVLTATAGTPAATNPATLTAAHTILAEDFDVQLLFGPTHRLIPWRFRVYPYDAGAGVIKFFTST